MYSIILSCLDGNCANFTILANFAAFLDHTKENADMSRKCQILRYFLHFQKVHA